jgi:hypothetical protein
MIILTGKQRSNDFPLYTEAVKFFNQPESMIRVAVRTLTLNVFKGIFFVLTITFLKSINQSINQSINHHQDDCNNEYCKYYQSTTTFLGGY